MSSIYQHAGRGITAMKSLLYFKSRFELDLHGGTGIPFINTVFTHRLEVVGSCSMEL